MKDKAQLSMLVFGNMDLATRNSSFAIEEKKNEAGDVTSQTCHALKRKDAAAIYGMDVDDERLDEKIMEDSDAQIDRMIELLNKARADKEGFWTGGRSKLTFGKRGKSGKVSRAKIELSLIESRRPQGPSDAAYYEKLAKSYQMPGESFPDALARVTALIEKQKAELAKQAGSPAVDVHPPGADTTPAIPEKVKTDDEILAEMEAEEALSSKV